ncbi:toll-like receptor Tollo [Plodia interpunctella]|uniref:toll-like receptor Tollo n=1 Tax=Plodia interpunctella TaxID=58824 RepID=UPI00236872A1|nr:toll-like receptor Tollo [Plodia interpunctella]
MCSAWYTSALVVLSAAVSALSASLSATTGARYQAPDECRWTTDDSDAGVALQCRLRTINSELENTNFSAIQPHLTVRLRLECSDALFFQSSLAPGSFRQLIELRELTIEYCKIGNLSDGAFTGLRELRNLTIRTHNTDWSSMSLEITSTAFSRDVQNLERLDLSENNMFVFPEGALCSLRNLEYLNMTGNRMRDISHFQFSTAHRHPTEKCGDNLLVLDLSRNIIDTLPPNLLSGLRRLQKLNLQGNGLNSIADRALEGLISLTTIRFSDNILTSLPPELFSDTKELKEIYLNNNTITVLAPGLFSDLVQLLVLDLSWNELTSDWINTSTFSGLKRLVYLDFSHNRVSKMEIALFRDLHNLQILKMQENFIEHIPENVFSTLSNLHTLILSNNRLTTIESYAFTGLQVLTVLSIDSNRISKINPQSLRNCSSLQDLHLNGNRLDEVPLALKEIPQLKTLDLGENLIVSIENASFIAMQQMYGLRLTENNIGNISKGVFDKMTSLKILNLSRNKIHKIEAGAFDNNINLQAIRLDGNYLTDIGGLFAKLPNLVWLNISDNRLGWFDYAMIPTGLQWLDIHANRIAELGNYFEIESQLSLSTFDASSNKLTEITGSAIPNSVEMLYLNDNLISKVQSYTFFKKPNLTRVDLYGNKITNLDPNSLRISAVPQDKSVPEFFIGGNPLECDCTMEWLQKINTGNRARTQPKLMDLDSINCKLLYNRGNAYVPLVEAASHQFLCKYEFHCFALCHCCDFDACDCEMTCPNNCTCYHDQSWSANVVECSSAGYVNTLPERIPMEATQLYLDGNDIKMLPSHAFIGRKRLKILYLNASNIETIHNRTFNGLKELEVLHLDYNNLIQIEGQEFGGLDNLRELYLNNNNIKHIGKEMFDHMARLKILHLHHNRLITLSVWQINAAITEITLSYNPWSCDCDYTEMFREWAKRVNSITDLSNIRCIYSKGNRTEIVPYSDSIFSEPDSGFSVINENGSICTGLPSINNSINGNLTATKTIITNEVVQDYMLLIISLGLLLLVLFVSTIVFVFRQEMRVWFHSKYGVRLFYRSSDIDRESREKMFDAFVSYSSKDEAWVAEELVPMLERGDPSYKLCLHYRDIPMGSYAAENIMQAVESSRRTIMVLSENFIKSEWCRYDFKSAHHQVLRDRRRRLIVILLGDVPQKDLDQDIKLYLKTNTYLHTSDKLFWEKLRFALPDVQGGPRIRDVPSPVVNSSVAMHRHHHARNHLGALPPPPVHGAHPVLPPHPSHNPHQMPPRASPRTMSVHV